LKYTKLIITITTELHTVCECQWNWTRSSAAAVARCYNKISRRYR